MVLVVFRNRRRAGIDAAAYAADAARMQALARARPGHGGFERNTADDGEAAVLSGWHVAAAARAWGRKVEPLAMPGKGRSDHDGDHAPFACPDPRVRRFARKAVPAQPTA